MYVRAVDLELIFLYVDTIEKSKPKIEIDIYNRGIGFENRP